MKTLLRRNFYYGSPVLVARKLIGKTLVRRLEDGTFLEGVIVETEAYAGKSDPASHAFRGMTTRNRVMFGEAGHAYVYFTYGFHNCLNFVTGKEGIASAVLIRAVEPTKGVEKMAILRNTKSIANIASGPGKLCQAFSINRSLNGIDVTLKKSAIYVLDTDLKLKVGSSARIGIAMGVDKRWRFYAVANVHVSKKPR
ncbi:MAG: DNA-3-methyladenine glycosylase [Nitrososphaerota archaeon]|jgi:DNA-3-methyladenine glycosylase|nr:DNA-3-methyladenine glycosylase [Nitrososphaerota archaeon]